MIKRNALRYFGHRAREREMLWKAVSKVEDKEDDVMCDGHIESSQSIHIFTAK